MQRVSDCLEQALTVELDISQDALDLAATLEDLGLDSLGLAELIDILKARLGIPIGDEELSLRMTLGQSVAVLEAKVEDAAPQESRL
jgi:acyl carrier protein